MNKKNRFIAVNSKGKFGIITNTDKQVAPFIYDNIQGQDEINNYARFTLKDSIGVINLKTGKTRIVGSKYDNVFFIDENRISISSVGKYGVQKVNGEIIIPLTYDRIEPNNKEYVVKLDEKWGLLNKKGKYLTEQKFDKIRKK